MSDDQLSRLLELADGPTEFPAAQRGALRAAMLDTATRSAEPEHSAESTVVPLEPVAHPRRRRSRHWLLGAVAVSAAFVVAALVISMGPTRSPAPPTATSGAPADAVAPLCDEVRDIADANGLIGSGSPTDSYGLDRLAAALDEIAGATLDDGLADLATRVRLLARAVGAAQGATVLNTMQAIGDDVEQIYRGAGPCAE